MLVKDAMNRNAPRINHNATMKEAAEMMALTQSGELVVVGTGELVRGMVGPSEILRCLVPEYEDLLYRGEAPGKLQPQRRSTDALPRIKVGEIMRRVTDPLEPDQTLESALGRLLESGGRPLPVVREGKLEGSLSTADIARALMWRDRVSPSRIRPQEERRKGV